VKENDKMINMAIVSVIYMLFILVPIILFVFLVIALWKMAKAHETIANSSKEIAEALKNRHSSSPTPE
jgi:uncharacterized membrane protein